MKKAFLFPLICMMSVAHISWAAPIAADTLSYIKKQDIQKLSWTSDGTRELLVSKIQPFFKNLLGAYIRLDVDENGESGQENLLVSNQFMAVFAGPPEEEIDLSDGKRLFVAHRIHENAEMAFVVTDSKASQILATALYHHNCGRNNGRSKADREKFIYSCDNTPGLTIFFNRNLSISPEIDKTLRKFVADYAKNENQESKKLTSSRINSVDVKYVKMS